MTFDLSSITVNTAGKPPRLVVYGDHGIGKTTFATSAPGPIVLRTEDGLAGIQVPTFPQARSFDDVLNAINTLYTQKHPFQTLVVDTLDWLEPLVWAHTAAVENKTHIEDFGYGKGFKLADGHWRTFLDGLDALNRERGMTIICLAHAVVKRFSAPDTEPFDRYQLALHDRAIGLVSQWADVIAFAHAEVFTVTTETNGKKVTRGTGGQRRLLSVEERPAFDAKNRYNLPADLDFPRVGAWDVFATACAPAYSAPAPAPLELEIPALPPLSRQDQAGVDTVERLFGDELADMAPDIAAAGSK